MSNSVMSMEWMTPGANLNAYIQGASSVPILTAEEERHLGEIYFKYDEADYRARDVYFVGRRPSAARTRPDARSTSTRSAG